jgi:2-phosphoglycerate kinase
MKLRIGNEEMPYPLFTMKGRLRVSGLTDQAIAEIVNEKSLRDIETEEDLYSHIRNSLASFDSSISSNFDVLTKYEMLRGESSDLPPIVVAIEGASATGKTLIALELIHDLTATRFISTDSLRQIIRGLVSQEDHPELFCHTYQAYNFRQVGPTELDSRVRGFLAQCEIITPHVISIVERLVAEGAIGVIEGVHLEPGTLEKTGPGVVEVLVNPNPDTHRLMFASKHAIGKLKTISKDIHIREAEFGSARAIQEYMIKIAEKSKIPIVPLTEYDDARKKVSSIIVSRVKKLLHSFEEGAVRL